MKKSLVVAAAAAATCLALAGCAATQPESTRPSDEASASPIVAAECEMPLAGTPARGLSEADLGTIDSVPVMHVITCADGAPDNDFLAPEEMMFATVTPADDMVLALQYGITVVPLYAKCDSGSCNLITSVVNAGPGTDEGLVIAWTSVDGKQMVTKLWLDDPEMQERLHRALRVGTTPPRADAVVEYP